MNATYAERAGAAKEQSEAYKIRGLLGQQTAGQAASGLDVNSGSALDVRRGTAGLGNLSFANIRDNTAREAAGYRGQATNFANDAALAKASAPTPFSTVLGAASAAGGTYAGLGSPQLFGNGGGLGTAAGLGGTGVAAGAGALSTAGGMRAGAWPF